MLLTFHGQGYAHDSVAECKHCETYDTSRVAGVVGAAVCSLVVALFFYYSSIFLKSHFSVFQLIKHR